MESDMNISGKYYIGNPSFLMEQFNKRWKQVHKKKPVPYTLLDWHNFAIKGKEITFLGVTYKSNLNL